MFDPITEKVNIVNVLAPVSAAMNTSTSVVNLESYASCSFIVHKGAGAVGTATLTIVACDNTTPSNTTAVAFKYRRMVAATNANAWGTLTDATASGFVTTAAASDMYEIVVDPDAINKASVNGATGYSYCRLTITQSDATSVLMGVIAILGKARYAGATPVSAVA